MANQISNLPEDVLIDNVLSRLPVEDVVRTSVLSRDWKFRWVRVFEIRGDRITTLPNKVIRHVLSRLPTKDAVRTSVLSRAWAIKWTHIYNIDVEFDVENSIHFYFVDFVNKALLYCDSSKLRSFHINYELNDGPCCYVSEILKQWIFVVIKRSVCNLHIHAPGCSAIDFRQCLSGWTSLTELKLSMNCTIYIPLNANFPNLKNLLISSGNWCGIKIRNQRVDNTRRIVLIFPVLEVLVLKCQWLYVDVVEIQAPKIIEFTNDLFELKRNEIDFFVSGPVITYAYYNNRDYSSDVAAVADTELQVSQILKRYPTLKCLSLSSNILAALVRFGSSIVLPTFDQVKEFELLDSDRTDCLLDGDRIDCLVRFLQVLPSLESLALTLRSADGRHIKKIKVSHLKEIKYGVSSGTKWEIGYARSMLKNADNLERMQIQVWYPSEKGMSKIRAYLKDVKPKNPNCIVDVRKLGNF